MLNPIWVLFLCFLLASPTCGLFLCSLILSPNWVLFLSSLILSSNRVMFLCFLMLSLRATWVLFLFPWWGVPPWLCSFVFWCWDLPGFCPLFLDSKFYQDSVPCSWILSHTWVLLREYPWYFSPTWVRFRCSFMLKKVLLAQACFTWIGTIIFLYIQRME